VLVLVLVCWLSCSAVTLASPATNNVQPRCVSDCSGLDSGDYQSCVSCNQYVTCVHGSIVDNRPCPAKMVWDDNRKLCAAKSTTCSDEREGRLVIVGSQQTHIYSIDQNAVLTHISTSRNKYVVCSYCAYTMDGTRTFYVLDRWNIVGQFTLSPEGNVLQSKLPNAPSTRVERPISFVKDNALFYGGGSPVVQFPPVPIGEGIDSISLDGEGNKWATNSSPMPVTVKWGLQWAAVGVARNAVIVTGGQTKNIRFSNEAYSLTSVSGQWKKLPSMSIGRYYHCSVGHGDDLFVFGGLNRSGRIDSVEKFNTKSEKWVSMSSMPKALDNMACTSFGDKILVLGGVDRYFDAVIDPVTTVDSIFIYTVSTDTWEISPTKLPEKMGYHAAGILTN